MLNIDTLPKAEMASHLGEIVSTQDEKISRLRSEKRVLWVLLGLTLAVTFIS
jgi:hypothetical protein